TNFGAFVDIGVHQDGLVHLSQITNRFIKDPNEVLKVHQQVEVTVTEVDVNRKRISLSMKSEEPKTNNSTHTPKKVHQQPAKPVKKAEPVETDMAIKLAELRNKFK
ncbi:MAG: RNA-binding transcriptional accessory protein, partial [Mucilaginibacter sp.]|nr:RNA-binding transcriptional accessory protein [Mucilaginibacter sp.]